MVPSYSTYYHVYVITAFFLYTFYKRHQPVFIYSALQLVDGRIDSTADEARSSMRETQRSPRENDLNQMLVEILKRRKFSMLL